MPELKVPQDSELFEIHYIPKFTKGLNFFTAEEPEDGMELLVAKNVRFNNREVLLDTGYKAFGTFLAPLDLSSEGRATFQLFKKDGENFHTLLTDKTLYIWEPILEQWHFANDGDAVSTLTAALIPETNTVAVVDGSLFSVGEMLGITLNGGAQVQRTITGRSGNTLFVDFNFNDSHTASVGNAVVQAISLSGDPNIPVSITTYPPFDWMVFVNGVDTPKYFDGSVVKDVPNLPGTTFTARIAVTYRDHLLFLNVTESGNHRPQRVRWSATGDATNWSTLGASFNELLHSDGWITAAVPLGPYLIVYKEDSIVRMELLGLLFELFSFNVMISDEGVASPTSVLLVGDQQVFFGQTNIYVYQGGYSLTPIGRSIQDGVFLHDSEFKAIDKSKVLGLYVEELEELWFLYRISSPGITDSQILLRYNIPLAAFSFRFFLSPITGLGFYSAAVDPTWLSMEDVTWEDAGGAWGTRLVGKGLKTVNLLFKEFPKEYDFESGLDDSTGITFTLETRDFYIPNFFLSVDMVEFSLKHDSAVENVLIEYSLDFGQTYAILGEVQATTEYARYRLWGQLFGRSVRWRLSGNGGPTGTFGLQWLAFTYKLESLW